MQTARTLTKPSRHRKFVFQAPAHIRHRLLAAHLSDELRTQHGAKSFPVRTGDTVKVLRGDHKGVEGKISRVDLKKYRIYVEGLTREKVDGTTISVPVHPSKVVVTKINLEDKWRKEILEEKKKRLKRLAEEREEPKRKSEKRPEEKAVKIKEAVEEAAKEVTVVREKPPAKKVKRARKKQAEKKDEMKEKAKPKAEEAEEKPKKRSRRTARKMAKKPEKKEE